MKTIMPRFHWKHKTKYGDEYCVMCECTNVLYSSINYTDYYCSQCGAKINWDEFIKKHKDDPDTREVIKKIAEELKDEI